MTNRGFWLGNVGLTMILQGFVCERIGKNLQRTPKDGYNVGVSQSHDSFTLLA